MAVAFAFSRVLTDFNYLSCTVSFYALGLFWFNTAFESNNVVTLEIRLSRFPMVCCFCYYIIIIICLCAKDQNKMTLMSSYVFSESFPGYA